MDPKTTGGKRRRRKDCKPTSEAQAWCNRIHAEQKLFYYAHANFGLTDYRLGLDFADQHLPESLEDLKRMVRLFWLRVKRIYKKHGVTLKYIWIPERSGKGRYHIHGFLSGGVPREEVERAWGKGRANCIRFSIRPARIGGICALCLQGSDTGKALVRISQSYATRTPAIGLYHPARRHRRGQKVRQGSSGTSI